MQKQEHAFCETEGKHITILNPVAVIETLLEKPPLSFENILNLFFVVRDCIQSKSDSWIIHTKFQENPITLTVPLKKRKPSEQEVMVMTKCYEESSNDDLALAKECEGMDSDIDIDSCE
jgi:hypothetical protein